MICETTITLIEKPGGMDGYGRAKWVPVAANVPCHFRPRMKRLLRGDATEVVSTATIYIFDPVVEIGDGYRVTINGQALVVIERAPATHDVLKATVCYLGPR